MLSGAAASPSSSWEVNCVAAGDDARRPAATKVAMFRNDHNDRIVLITCSSPFCVAWIYINRGLVARKGCQPHALISQFALVAARSGRRSSSATIAAASTTDASVRLKSRPTCATGLSRKSPTAAPSGRVRMSGAQKRFRRAARARFPPIPCRACDARRKSTRRRRRTAASSHRHIRSPSSAWQSRPSSFLPWSRLWSFPSRLRV